MLMIVKFPPAKFNVGVADGRSGAVLMRFVEEMKPEASYFTELDGRRAAVFVVDVQDTSELPKYAEPFYLNFEAEVELHPTMLPEDLGRAGIDGIAKSWG